MVKSVSSVWLIGWPEAGFGNPTLLLYADLVAAWSDCMFTVDLALGEFSMPECVVCAVEATDVVPV